MKNGLYRYKDEYDKTNYGEVILSVKETEKSIIFELIKNDMRYSPAHIDLMFDKSNKVNVNKNKSPHAINKGDDYFVLYPCRAGIPFLFKRI